MPYFGWATVQRYEVVVSSNHQVIHPGFKEYITLDNDLGKKIIIKI